MRDQTESRCPRCGEGRFLSWDELDDEGREVVMRLPASAYYTQDERRATHRWCERCWHEEIEDAPRDA